MSKSEKKSRSLLIKTGGLIIVAVLAVIIVTAIIFNKTKSKISNLSAEKTELQNNLEERDSIVNELVGAFDSIENNLTFINKKRSQLMVENKETKPSQQEIIIRDIRLMDDMLIESSQKIEELEKRLKDSGIQLKAFKNKIASLYKNIEQQNIQIAAFKSQIEDQDKKLIALNQQNDNLESTLLAVLDTIALKEKIIVQKEEIIEKHISTLNKGFFASGTYKELFENGVVLKQGGFLGLGKNKILQNNFNDDYFTEVDITQNRTIPLNAKKINLISEHPVNSYKLIEEGGLITKLEIEIPEDFWKITHYAVIEVK